MAVSQVYTAIAGDVISAARWNNEFGNIYNNGTSIAFPLTGNVSFGGFAVTNVSFTFGTATTNADVGFLISGTQITGAAMGVQISSTTNPATTESSYGLNVVPVLTEFSSGLHPLFAGINVAPTVTAGAGTLTTLAGISTGALTAQSGTTNAAAIYVDAAPTGATNNFALWAVAGSFRFDGAGPHAIGGATAPGSQLSLAGTFAPATTNVFGLDLVHLLTVPANGIAAGMVVESTFTEAGSGVHANLSGIDLIISITNAAATVTDAQAIRVRTLAAGSGTTNASGIKIEAAPTGASNNYSLWVDAGPTKLDGTVTIIADTATPAGGSTTARLVFGTTAGFGIYYGSGAPTVSAAQGSFYMRSDGSGTTTRAYINTDGGTTWTNLSAAA